MYLYLDESGDLGFDLDGTKCSKYFTVCILVAGNRDTAVSIRKAVRKTLRRKVNKGSNVKKLKTELKATQAKLEIKKYLFKLISRDEFSIYAVTLDKAQVISEFSRRKEHVYNYIAGLVLDKISFESALSCIQLVIDKSKNKREIANFNDYIISQLEGRISPKVLVYIDHINSYHEAVLQAVDLFAWGIFRKYEKKDYDWFNVFKNKIKCDEVYPQ